MYYNLYPQKKEARMTSEDNSRKAICYWLKNSLRGVYRSVIPASCSLWTSRLIYSNNTGRLHMHVTDI